MNPARLRLLLLLALPACGEGAEALPDADAAMARSEEEVPVVVDSLIVRIAPDSVRQGTLFRIHVRTSGTSAVTLSGSFAGEPLHFEGESDGGHWALAGAPIDSLGTVELLIEPSWNGEPSLPQRYTVPLVAGDYRMERLSVPPEYTTYPPEIERRINAESARAMAVSRNSHRTTKLWSLPFVHPREDRITSGFGHGRTFNGAVQSRHMGTDYAGAVGAPVLAPARGVVALRDTFYLGGNVLYLDHGAGLVTAYLHLSEQLVAEGDTVDAGDLIARVGATGRVTGPHLHWIVRYGELTVDGQSLLDLR